MDDEGDAGSQQVVDATDVAEDPSANVDVRGAEDDAADTSHTEVSDVEATDADADAHAGADASPAPDTSDAADALDATSNAVDAYDAIDAPGLPDVEVDPVVTPLGAACTRGTTCASGFCGNGRCAPQGFSYIAPGTFTMGSPTSEVGRGSDETQHSVTLTRAFFLQQTEVTQGQWRTLMGNNPSNFTGCGDSCPVEQVNWYEALAYANALSDAEGLSRCYTLSGCSNTPGNGMQCSSVSVTAAGGNPVLCEGYRLPTESEWEYAARAGTTTATYRGNLQEPPVCDPQPNLEPIAWYCENASVTYAGSSDCSGYGGPSSCGTRTVATRAANNWGLYDMLGNLWEWCWDGYGTYPDVATDPLGAASGSSRVLRGGSWAFDAAAARAAQRDLHLPGSGGFDRGFRLARSL